MEDFSIGVASWNLHGLPFLPSRKQRMLRALRRIEEYRPCITCLQEVWLPADRRAVCDYLESAGYVVAENPAATAVSLGGGLVTAIRATPKWFIARTSFIRFKVNGPVWKLWQGDGIAGKGIHRIELQHVSDGQMLVVLNTHLQARYRPGGYKRVRLEQIGQMNDMVRSIPSHTPVLAVGDFNSAAGDPRDCELLATLERDEWADLSAPARAVFSGGTCVRTADWIDYVFGRRSVHWRYESEPRLILNRSLDDPYSDHHGLVVQVHARYLKKSPPKA